MRHLLTAGLVAILLVGSVRAQTTESAYFCREEFAGGLGYNENSKSWQGVVFSTRRNFLLKLKPAGTTGEGKYQLDLVKATVTAEGTSLPVECLDVGQDIADMDKVSVGRNGILRCEASVAEYQFNRMNNRFLKIYAYGYINGADNNDDTPFVSGGHCTKIN